MKTRPFTCSQSLLCLFNHTDEHLCAYTLVCVLEGSRECGGGTVPTCMRLRHTLEQADELMG